MRNRNFSPEDLKEFQERRQKNRVFFGVAIALVGVALMLRTMGILPHFSLRLSWPIILIFVGLFIGLRHNFRNNAWWILMLVGGANLTPQFMLFGQPSTHFVWPAMIILIGLAIAFRPRQNRCTPGKRQYMDTTINTDTNLNVDVTFGGRKEIVTTKDFKGGVVSVTFAGCELNLAQADIVGTSAIIDFRVSFGGVELVVPSHWEIQNEVNPSFGSIDDKRTIQTAVVPENKKILILRGTCSFGSVELKSY